MSITYTIHTKIAYFIALDNLINPGDGYSSHTEQNGKAHYFSTVFKDTDTQLGWVTSPWIYSS